MNRSCQAQTGKNTRASRGLQQSQPEGGGDLWGLLSRALACTQDDLPYPGFQPRIDKLQQFTFTTAKNVENGWQEMMCLQGTG